MIKKITPSKIVVEYLAKDLTIEGEALLPGHGSPNYVVFTNSIKGWDQPNSNLPFTDEDKNAVIDLIKKSFEQREMTYEFE